MQANGLQPLFSDDEVVHYQDVDDLIGRIRYFKEHDSERIRIAANGRRRAHDCYSAERIARYMVETTCRIPGREDPPWPLYRYGD